MNYYLDELSYENIIACLQAYRDKEAIRIRKLYDYYNGKQLITKREEPENRPCNNIVTNLCRSITDSTIGFMNFGEAVSNFDKAEIESVMKDTLMVGVGYGLLEYDNSQLTLKRIPATRALVIKDTTLAHNPIAGVIYNEYTVYEHGVDKRIIQVFIYTNTEVQQYKGSSLASLEFIEKHPHFVGMLPLLEAKSTVNYESIYGHAISLQDAYNLVQSSYIDGRETFSSSFLLVEGMSISQDTANDLIDGTNKIINLPVPNSDARYLVKDDSATDVISSLQDIKANFHSVTLVPDFEKETNYGTTSGKSQSFRTLNFINLVKSRENIFKQYFLDLFDTFIFPELLVEQDLEDTNPTVASTEE